MKYSPDIIQTAYAELDKRRQSAITEFNRHVEEIENNCPEIYKIYCEIASTSSKLSAVVFSGSDDVRAEVEKIKNDNLSAQKKLFELLESFGYPKNYLIAEYCCPICLDTGTVLGNRCECVTKLMNELTIAKLNEQCKIKLHSFSEFSLDYYPETIKYGDSDIPCRELMERNFKVCMEYAKNFSAVSPGLFMYGGTGLGKTFLSSCIASELLKRGVNVAFDSVQNYLRNIEREHFGKSEGDTLEAIINSDLLILDDLGCEFSSPFNTSTVYNIINSRCNLGKPTIISTNLSIKELTDRYDERIVSRLTGNLMTIRFVGKDIRLIKMRNGLYN